MCPKDVLWGVAGFGSGKTDLRKPRYAFLRHNSTDAVPTEERVRLELKRNQRTKMSTQRPGEGWIDVQKDTNQQGSLMCYSIVPENGKNSPTCISMKCQPLQLLCHHVVMISDLSAFHHKLEEQHTSKNCSEYQRPSGVVPPSRNAVVSKARSVEL